MDWNPGVVNLRLQSSYLQQHAHDLRVAHIIELVNMLESWKKLAQIYRNSVQLTRMNITYLFSSLLMHLDLGHMDNSVSL